jgi:hypothetical protein
MSQRAGGYRASSREPSGWVVGGVVFAATMMIMAGIFEGLAGLIAIVNNEFFVATRNYLFKFDATTWGWIHLILGIVVGLAGVGLLGGRLWARAIAIILLVLSATANFLSVPYYPFWSLLVIAIDVVVIWALATHGRDVGA